MTTPGCTERFYVFAFYVIEFISIARVELLSKERLSIGRILPVFLFEIFSFG